jgi:hypothetical protein
MRKLLAVGLVLASLLFALVMNGACSVNRMNFERIKLGMTQAEVEKILGGPPGDYRTQPVKAESYLKDIVGSLDEQLWPGEGEFDLTNTDISLDEWIWPELVWRGNEGDIAIVFKPGEGVIGSLFRKAMPHDTNPVATTTWRLERLMERWFP